MQPFSLFLAGVYRTKFESKKSSLKGVVSSQYYTYCIFPLWFGGVLYFSRFDKLGGNLSWRELCLGIF